MFLYMSVVRTFFIQQNKQKAFTYKGDKDTYFTW